MPLVEVRQEERVRIEALEDGGYHVAARRGKTFVSGTRMSGSGDNHTWKSGALTPNVPSDAQGLYLLTIPIRTDSISIRVFKVGFGGVTESVQSSLLQSVITLFSSPDGYTGSSVQAAIASSSGTFTSIWQTRSVDGYAYGLTSLQVDESPHEWLNRDSIERSIDEMVRTKL